MKKLLKASIPIYNYYMKITIYSTASCGFCKMLKKYLSDKGFEYEEKMADADESIARELYEKSHQFAVPFTVIEKNDGSTDEILGFDIKRLNDSLDLAN